MKLYDDPISFELFSIPARVWTLTMNYSYGMFYKSKQTSENRWRCEIPFESYILCDSRCGSANFYLVLASQSNFSRFIPNDSDLAAIQVVAEWGILFI